MMRQPIERRSETWKCQDNNLSLNVIKTMELIARQQASIIFDGAEVEQVESFKFLCVHITNKLTWSKQDSCQHLSLSGD
jgi:hypothetical protein